MTIYINQSRHRASAERAQLPRAAFSTVYSFVKKFSSEGTGPEPANRVALADWQPTGALHTHKLQASLAETTISPIRHAWRFVVLAERE